mgnify:CR=1 FL=1
MVHQLNYSGCNTCRWLPGRRKTESCLQIALNPPVPLPAQIGLTPYSWPVASQVVRNRKKHRIGYGAADNKDLCKAIAAHSNAVENIPLALFLLLMLEINQLNQTLLIAFGLTLLFARIIHAFGLSKSITVSFGRTYGTMLTWLIMIAMAALNVGLTLF